MFEKIISFSIRNTLIVFIMVLALIIAGVWSLQHIAIDAVPDITNNQVQVVTTSPTLAPQEIEQVITFPLESKLMNLPGVEEVRSISRFGLSVVTVVFEEHVPTLQARQLVKEQIDAAAADIPSTLGSPELMPITTGLGEIYQYVLRVKPGYEHLYDDMELRTIQDWIVKRQLAGTKGIIEISSFGGRVKQYEVSVDPKLLRQNNVSISDVFDALEKNNENSGGSYVERNQYAYYIRSEGRVRTKEDIENIVIRKSGNVPLLIRDVAKVNLGSPNRYGAMTMDGKGEVVGGITLMLKGANSSYAIRNVHERVKKIASSLPEGIEIYPYMDRSVLVAKTSSTVTKNLIEGGLIVIFVLVVLLGNFRAGFIVASVIPLAMLFALILMYAFGVSANLMSLGAIDFGIVVDGAVIIVESVLHVLHENYAGKKLSKDEMGDVVNKSSHQIIQSAAFGVLIILIVFVPIMTLTGIEGKMFKPMAQTVSFALMGALILSLTYVPMMSSLFLKRHIHNHVSISDRIVNFFKRIYTPVLSKALQFPKTILMLAFSGFTAALILFSFMGGEFIPTLEEGDLAMQMTLKPGSSLQESIRATNMAEKILLENFPEVKHVVAKIGT
ncbi:MAG: efflux RND transporter permease subunit, partial [Flavobacteriales bacterium]|nr:efflux RND transporter permease subunit [Flavobacteriales bacterium]